MRLGHLPLLLVFLVDQLSPDVLARCVRHKLLHVSRQHQLLLASVLLTFDGEADEVLLRLLDHVRGLDLALNVFLVLSLVDLRVELVEMLLVYHLLEVLLLSLVRNLWVVVVVHVLVDLVVHILQRVVDLELAVLAEVRHFRLLHGLLGHVLVSSLLQFLAEVI